MPLHEDGLKAAVETGDSFIANGAADGHCWRKFGWVRDGIADASKSRVHGTDDCRDLIRRHRVSAQIRADDFRHLFFHSPCLRAASSYKQGSE